MNSQNSAEASRGGQIRVGPTGRYFVDEAGRPVFWLGDTQWDLFRCFRPAEALEILADRQAKGFNVILVMLLGIDVTKLLRHLEGHRDDLGPPHANVDGQTPWIGGDPLQPNEEYFRHVDAMIRLGERTGQTFVVGVYHQWQADVITPAKARPWARWVASRYRDVPNLIWSMYPRATGEFIPVCRALAAGLREGDGGSHLISVHPDPAVASSSFLHEEDWLAFNMIQTCLHYDRIPETVTADYHRTPTKPVVMAEGGYEGAEMGQTQTPHDIRKQAYWTQLAGGHHVYGHNDNWVSPAAWRRWIDSPGSRHLRIFREIITARDRWWEMVPDASLLASGAGSGSSLNAAARSPDGRWVLAYLPEPSCVSLRLGAIPPGASARACWIDPTTGDRHAAGAADPAGAWEFTTPQGWQDAVLLVEAK